MALSSLSAVSATTPLPGVTHTAKSTASSSTRSSTTSSAKPASVTEAAAAPAAAPGKTNVSKAASSGSSSSVASSAASDAAAAVYSTTVAGKSYSGSVSESGGVYTASVPNLSGASASGSSVQAAENSLNTRVDELV